jgi:hypothetical protein
VNSSSILRRYEGIHEILIDKDLAKLGDAYVNFIHSLALSRRSQKPMGARMDNQTLANALKNAGLREILPKRIDRHTQGNAAEALIVYAWLNEILSLNEGLNILIESETIDKAYTDLLLEINRRIKEFIF